MSIKAMQQQPTYRVQPLVRADKARREIREQTKTAKKELRREFADRETRVISILVAVFLVVGLIVWPCVSAGIIDGPVYLTDFM